MVIKYGRYKPRLDKEEEFTRSRLWFLFKLIFHNEQEALRAYRILKCIKRESHGFRIHGNKMALTQACKTTIPALNRTLKKMIDLKMIEVREITSNAVNRNLRTKEETGLAEDFMLVRESKRKSKFLVISDSIWFVSIISLGLEEWIKFKRPPLITKLTMEMKGED